MTGNPNERSIAVTKEAYAIIVRIRAERELKDGVRLTMSEVATELIMRGLVR